MTARQVIAAQEAQGTRPSPPRPAGSTEVDDHERPVIEELRALGVDIYGVHQLSDKADQHPAMRAVLFTHLGGDYDDYTRSRMAAALGGRGIRRDEFDQLVRAYRAESSEFVKERFADAVSRCGAAYLNDVIDLIKDTSLGGSRVLLVKALTRSRQARARDTLRLLRDDPDLKVALASRVKD